MMPVLMQCTSKKCGKMNTAYLDKDTDQVHCGACDEIINNVSVFTKRQMRFNKEFRPKHTKSFSVKCAKCNKDERPVLSGDDILCGACKKPLDQLTPFFKIMLKERLKSLGEDK